MHRIADYLLSIVAPLWILSIEEVCLPEIIASGGYCRRGHGRSEALAVVDANYASAGISLVVVTRRRRALFPLLKYLCWHSFKKTPEICVETLHPIMMKHKKSRLTFPRLTFSSKDDRTLSFTVGKINLQIRQFLKSCCELFGGFFW